MILNLLGANDRRLLSWSGLWNSALFVTLALKLELDEEVEGTASSLSVNILNCKAILFFEELVGVRPLALGLFLGVFLGLFLGVLRGLFLLGLFLLLNNSRRLKC